jgi:hypothetical protein
MSDIFPVSESANICLYPQTVILRNIVFIIYAIMYAFIFTMLRHLIFECIHLNSQRELFTMATFSKLTADRFG